MKKGQVLEGTIEKVEFPNKGVVTVAEEGKSVIVKNGIPGQKVKFCVNKFKRGNAEIGYWLGQQYWGQGIAAKALHRFCTEVFSTHPEVWRLSASILAPNTASMRVAEKAGFHEEAVLRQAAYKRETLMDLHIFAVLRNQWR